MFGPVAWMSMHSFTTLMHFYQILTFNIPTSLQVHSIKFKNNCFIQRNDVSDQEIKKNCLQRRTEKS